MSHARKNTQYLIILGLLRLLGMKAKHAAIVARSVYLIH